MNLLRMLLDWAVLSVSFYNTISLVLLALMVLLNGNRRTGGTWLTGLGLFLAGLFFTSHTAILGRGLGIVGFGMDFWWWVSWAPAVAAPFSWYMAMLWHTGFSFWRPHPHRPWLAGLTIGAALVIFLLLFANPLPTYNYVAGRVLHSTPSILGMPVLILFYLGYSMACYLLPLDLLRRSAAADLNSRDPAATSRRKARPWLMAACVALALAGLVLAWTALWALTTTPIPSLSHPGVEQTVKGFDLVVSSLVAVAITLLGRTIVAYEVFTGRALPRVGLFRHWRSSVVLAAGFGAAAAWTLAFDLRPLYSLMLTTMLMTVFYALFGWRSFAEREEFMSRLRPFVASQDLYGQLAHPVANGNDADPHRITPQNLFETLGRLVLGTKAARLLPAGALATLAGPPLTYGAPEDLESLHRLQVTELAERFSAHNSRCLALHDEDSLVWAVALWNDQGLGGVLLLSEKTDGNLYTEEEIEIAQAGGERLLDMLAGVEMARLAMDLLRQRLAQERVLEGQGRRVLHDEILPQLHTAILQLSSQQPPSPAVQEAVQTLATAHRRISDLIRDVPPSVPHRLGQGGLVSALRGLVGNDFARDFATVRWEIDPAAEEQARLVPLFVLEVIFFAARELVRNAARYGSGPEARPVTLTIGLDRHSGLLRLWVSDNGVGLGSSTASSGSGSGLRFHSAMLAAVGASLQMSSQPEGGVIGLILFPGQPAPLAAPRN